MKLVGRFLAWRKEDLGAKKDYWKKARFIGEGLLIKPQEKGYS